MYALLLLQWVPRRNREESSSWRCGAVKLRSIQTKSFFWAVTILRQKNIMYLFFLTDSSRILPGALMGVILGSAGCGNGKEAKAAAPQAVPVKVETAKAQKVDDTADYVDT